MFTFPPQSATIGLHGDERYEIHFILFYTERLVGQKELGPPLGESQSYHQSASF